MSPTLLKQLTPTGNKSQLVRLLDVFVFGPLMIKAAADQESKYFRAALLLIGLGTILYNGANYLQTRQAAAQRPPQDNNAPTLAGVRRPRAGPRPRPRWEGMH